MTTLGPGSVIARRYRLDRELTRGGMGVVWAASHLVTKRRVAIKLLRTDGNEDPSSRARLLREARASCAVDHPNVLPVLDVIDAEGAPALVMDLLDGESLRERLDRQRALTPREACAILAPVAAALAAAHAARIVHRDIKPENIFLVSGEGDSGSGGKPIVKVLDFGIAKIVATEEPTTNLTESGAMLGTPYYMAPEQAFGERDVGVAVDAWSLGIVLYECLSGARPTQAENLGQVIKRITRDPIAPIEESVTGIPPELAALMTRLLQRDVAAREIDMPSVVAILTSCADARAPAPAPAPARFTRTAIALLVLAVASTAAILALRSAPPPTDAKTDLGPSAPPTNLGPLPAQTNLGPAPAPSSSASQPTAIVVVQPAQATGAGTTTTRMPGTTATGARSGGADALDARAPLPTPMTEDGGTTGPGHVIIKAPF